MGNQKKIRIVSGQLGLSGQNIVFENEDFFGLKVGESVTRIGNGKENGVYRTDDFTSPVKYVGSTICQFEKPEKMYAFEAPEMVNDENVYFLYGSTGEQIFTEAVYSKKTKKSYVRVYIPLFIKESK